MISNVITIKMSIRSKIVTVWFGSVYQHSPSLRVSLFITGSVVAVWFHGNEVSPGSLWIKARVARVSLPPFAAGALEFALRWSPASATSSGSAVRSAADRSERSTSVLISRRTRKSQLSLKLSRQSILS